MRRAIVVGSAVAATAGALVVATTVTAPTAARRPLLTSQSASPATALVRQTPRGARVDARGCRIDPLANVYAPYRLHMLRRCTDVVGVVRSTHVISDGDVHISVQLNPAYRALINRENLSFNHGWLVVEIVPADRPGCVPGRPPRPPHYYKFFGICTGADVAIPSVGAHVRVRGSLVVDELHGWVEIHPAWVLRVERHA
ncbi:MAG: hypothetical protein ABR520_01715 [Mycobacteriales bacterium]